MTDLLINNQWVAGAGYLLTSTTPDETKTLWKKNTASKNQVKQAVSAAQNAFFSWSQMPFYVREKIILAFAEQLKKRKELLADAIHLETGKPLWEAAGEVMAMINKITISIRAYHERTSEQQQDHLQLSHRAHGVMAVFGPYNFPGHLPNGHIVPALLAGNTIVFKPSEFTPWVAELTAEAWLEAGLPTGVLNLVQGAKDVGIALVDSDVQGVLFTGSSETGGAIHRQLGGKPEVLLALEMGGNNPIILGSDYAPDVAAHIILHSAFLSAGQRCTCARRLIVNSNDSQHQTTINKVIELAKRIQLNHPSTVGGSFMGPVISAKTSQQLLQAQENLVKLGGQPLLTMASQFDSSVHLSPGIIDVSPISSVPDQEYFGPLLQIERAESFDQAIKIANQTRFGLAAGLISDSPDEQQTFKQTIRAGVVSINAPTAGASSALPFGGIGASGNHRPSAFYAADYCAWPQAATHKPSTQALGEDCNSSNIRGLSAAE